MVDMAERALHELGVLADDKVQARHRAAAEAEMHRRVTAADNQRKLLEEAVKEATQHPFLLLADTMADLCNELKVAQGGALVQTFNGEGHSKFTNWLRDMERTKIRIQGNDERMRGLALATLKGNAAEFLVRLLKRDPETTWDTIAFRLKERFGDTDDSRCAKQTLRTMEQNKVENSAILVKGFSPQQEKPFRP